MMEIDTWIAGYKVRAFPWIDGENIYVNVAHYNSDKSLSVPPMWEKTVYVKDSERARYVLSEFLHSLVCYIAELKIPAGGYAKIWFK